MAYSLIFYLRLINVLFILYAPFSGMRFVRLWWMVRIKQEHIALLETLEIKQSTEI